MGIQPSAMCQNGPTKLVVLILGGQSTVPSLCSSFGCNIYWYLFKKVNQIINKDRLTLNLQYTNILQQMLQNLLGKSSFIKKRRLLVNGLNIIQSVLWSFRSFVFWLVGLVIYSISETAQLTRSRTSEEMDGTLPRTGWQIFKIVYIKTFLMRGLENI